MFKLTSIELTDVGRHRSIKKSINGHVVGLAAPNGAGKTTILQAMQWGITGNVDHPDPITAWIRRSSGPNPPKGMTVIIGFEANGKPGKITRRVTATTASRSLEWDDKTLTGDKAVNDALYEILGVDKRAVNSTVFIRQGEIGKLFGKDSERREFYTRIMMLGNLEKIADIADGYRKGVAGTVQDLGALKDAADAAYSEAAAFFEDETFKLKQMRDWSEDLRMTSLLLANMATVAEREGDLKTATELWKYASSDILDPAKYLAETEVELQETEDSIKKTADSLTLRLDTENRLGTAERTLERHKARFQAQVDLEVARAERKEAAAVVAGEDPASEIRRCEESLKVIDRLFELPMLLEAARRENVKATTLHEAKSSELNAITESGVAARSVHDAFKASLATRKELLRSVQDSEASCCPVCGGAGNIEFLKGTIAVGEQSVLDSSEKLTRLRAELVVAQGEERTALVRWRAAGDTLEKLQREEDSLKQKQDVLNEEQLQALLARSKEVLPQYQASKLLLAQLDARIAKLNQSLGDIVPLTQADIDDASGDVDAWAAKLENMPTRAALEHMADVNLTRKVALQRQLQDFRTKEAVLKRATDALADADQELTAHLALIQKDRPMLHRMLAAEVIDHEFATRVSGEVKAKQEEYQTQKGKIEQARTGMQAASNRVNEVDLQIAEQQMRIDLEKRLARLRDAFKPSGVTTDFLDYRFGQIAVLASEYLAAAGADFTVTASTDAILSYDFLRLQGKDETWLPQSRLSGGQRVRLAIATLRAVHALIMPDVGLLVLDEPTTHLDEEAVKSMADMLRGIGEEGLLQLIVCDHSPILIDAFDDVIEIPAA